ncbi:MAG: hypothetical protein WBM51_10860 [Pseudolabrys sp.]
MVRQQVGWQLARGALARWTFLALGRRRWRRTGRRVDGYGYESCVQWVPDYGWVNVCNYPSYGGYGYY